jgi:putative ABC transport system permease protein
MTPLATAPRFSLSLLMHQRSRLIASIGGVTFALLLMLLQVGFRNALLDSALELLRQMDADIVVIDKDKRPFLSRRRMAMERLYQAQSVNGVTNGRPVWVTLVQWKNLESGTLHPIRVVGFDPSRKTLLNDRVNEQSELLERRGTALIDARSRSSYGYVGRGRAEVNRREIEIVGTFPLGTDFEVDGTLLVSDETYFDLTRAWQTKMEMALLDVEPGVDVDDTIARLNESLPTDVRAFSKEQLIARDLEYWKSGTPISVILLVGVVLGFAVGVVICYQILYTEVLDHLAEFATLKAMGYSDLYIQCVVIIQALVLSLLGLIPAIVIGSLGLAALSMMSGLPAGLGLGDIASVGLLSLGMCGVAGVLALRKVRLMDPAELF